MTKLKQFSQGDPLFKRKQSMDCGGRWVTAPHKQWRTLPKGIRARELYREEAMGKQGMTG